MSFPEDVPLVEFMYLVFIRMPGERCRRRFSSFVCYVRVASFERYLLHAGNCKKRLNFTHKAENVYRFNNIHGP